MGSLNIKNPAFEAYKMDLEKDLSSALKSFKLNKKPHGVNVLYHYTDLNGLKGIIENQSFLSSNSAYLNDKEEFYYGVNLFKTAISSYQPQTPDEENIIEEISKELNNKSESYHFVTCFSIEGDSLSQWRAYANDGKGIAIGFNLKKLIEAFEPKASGLLIEYNLEVQNQAAQIIVERTIQFYSSRLEIFRSFTPENLNAIIADEANEVFNKYIGQFKHNSFIEEREYRFDLSIDKDINVNREISYRVGRNNLLVPFLYLKTNYQEEVDSRKENVDTQSTEDIQKKFKQKARQLPISELVIGPSLDYHLNKKSIAGFLKKNGYCEDIEIKESIVPYRI